MAYKISPNSLIHCDECGEDYSATYRRCPFCGARNAPPSPSVSRSAPEAGPAPAPPSGRSGSSVNLEDTYVFSGQDLFDDEAEEDSAPARPRGGKRLAEKPSSNPFASADINWPRMITFVCSLIIIVAAMVIVFTVVYPRLRDPATVESQSPSSPTGDPLGGSTESADPDVTDPGSDTTDPGTDPSTDVPPAGGSGELTAISFKRANDADFTLTADESHTIELVFTPADWSGTVTWKSSNTQYATADANGKVTNVNTTGQLRFVTITATVGDVSIQSKVYCRGVAATTEPPVTDPPASNPPASNPPATGTRGTVVNASDGLRVRSGPGTGYSVQASLLNGDPVTVLEDMGNGWYKISFTGDNGATEGYVLGEYLSIN